MGSTKARRGASAFAVVLGASLVLAACGGSSGGGGTASAGGTSPGKGKPECAQLTQFGDLSGKEVSVYTSIVAPEDQTQKDSYKLFESCTGATVKYEGSKEFEAQLVVRVKSGNPPDIAIVPQPGLLNTLVDADRQGEGSPQGRRRTTSTSGGARTGRLTAPSTASSTPHRWART